MNMSMANTEKNGMRGLLKRIDAVDATTAVVAVFEDSDSLYRA